MARRFGTDGVRGIANVELAPELAFQLGRAGAHVLTKHRQPGSTTRLLVGKDTRLSGDMLEAALVSGILSVGADAHLVGVLPTPGVAYLTAHRDVDAGVMISASHNPAADNGIKFFSQEGYKLPDQLEDEIEYYLDHPEMLPRPKGDCVGRVVAVSDWQVQYLQYLEGLATQSLAGLRVVLDCANGAASQLAPVLFRHLGAEVTAINASPDGLNINAGCGSTHLEGLSQAVLASQADLGLAFDGDADRLLAVDHQGHAVDGDAIMAICALYLKSEGRLRNNLLVATVMSNLGLEHAMRKHGIELLRAKVGDRYVLAMMQEKVAVLGGEQSGHIIFSEHSTTGDGLLTALQLTEIVANANSRLSDLAAIVQPLPQVLQSVRVHDKSIAGTPAVRAAIATVEQMLAESGRILVRPSGTEPVVRVMVEAESKTLAEEMVALVVAALEGR